MRNDEENQQGNGFFDKNTILAVVLSFLVFFGWNFYISKKYPPKPTITTPAQIVETKTSETPEAALKESAKGSTESTSLSKGLAPLDVKAQTLTYESANMDVEFTNSGFGIQKIALKEFSDRENKIIQYEAVNGLEPLMVTQVSGLKNFEIQKINETEFVGTLTAPGMRVIKKMTIDPSLFLIKTSVKISYDNAQALKLENNIQGMIEKVDKTLFLPAYEHQELFAATAEKTHREYLTLDTALDSSVHTATNIAAFNSQYFALAAINKSDIVPALTTSSDGKVGRLQIIYSTTEPKQEFDVSYDFYFGPKKMELLGAVNESLKELIDYGMFAFIGRPLLAIMKVIFSFFQNWGIAIILLTILVKIVLFPLHMYSIKSMKKMQKIQPRLKEIKEKYKNDPARANQETLALMKSEKANPLSGCLPALMQIPIFIALYSMLGKSFELYKQPFFLWIHDLSIKDPYFVMPILAGAVFFIQQKLTPTTGMDPAQAKVMMFMPVMITAFMLTVPSGLALYMFVNAVFSVFQQLLVMREKTT